MEEQRISGGQILASKLAKGKRGAGREEEGVLAGSRPPVVSHPWPRRVTGDVSGTAGF